MADISSAKEFFETQFYQEVNMYIALGWQVVRIPSSGGQYVLAWFKDSPASKPKVPFNPLAPIDAFIANEKQKLAKMEADKKKDK